MKRVWGLNLLSANIRSRGGGSVCEERLDVKVYIGDSQKVIFYTEKNIYRSQYNAQAESKKDEEIRSSYPPAREVGGEV